jgi:cysteinyl-tRNA synthetase, unknown class
MPLLLTQNQLPVLIALLGALVVVAILILRQLRNDRSTTRPIAPGSPTPGTHAPATRATAPATRTSTATPPPGTITTWGYQLQNLNIATAAASPFDVLVIDTTSDGSDDTTYTAADLARLNRRPDGRRRTVLAYLSIGEAESYRDYWDPHWKRTKPDWLLGENPEWKENYSVCFWKPEWQNIMCGAPEARLDRVIAAGFDGVYLDKCDVYDDLKRRNKAAASTRPDIEGDMVAFIARLSAYAKSKNPNFLVIMQNTEDLLDRAELRAALDGVAKEELLYGANHPEKPNSSEDVTHSRAMLDLMRADGKLVLVVEYLDDPTKIRHAVASARSFGYALYISPKNRKLNRLEYETLNA